MCERNRSDGEKAQLGDVLQVLHALYIEQLNQEHQLAFNELASAAILVKSVDALYHDLENNNGVEFKILQNSKVQKTNPTSSS